MQGTLASRRHKTVDSSLDVHVWTPAGFLRAGTMVLDEHGDRQMEASFRYEEAYLEHPHAFPLDPINLPLETRVWETDAPTVQLGAIFDAAPDAWGRRVVQASLPVGQGNVYREAFLRGADGIGAVLLTPLAHRPEPGERQDIDAIVAWSQRERPALSQLREAAAAARLLEEGEDLDENTRSLLAGSWTIGGARPKSIMRDDRPGAAPGGSLVVKFESSNGGGWRNRLEWVCLQLAAAAGLPVPAAQLVELDERGQQAALVLERFDRRVTAAGAATTRLHYVSAASLVSTKPTSPRMDSRHDMRYFSWKRLIELASQVCPNASTARVEMFARLAFNAAIHNTDDHLKNFGFLKVPDDPVHYEIAPVFDVSSQAQDGHFLWCGTVGRVYTLDDAIRCAREVGIAAAAAAAVQERIRTSLADRFDLYEQAQMTARQVATAEAWIMAGTPGAARPVQSIASTISEKQRG